MKNLYEFFGLEFDCSQEELKKAYRQIVKKTHPDSLIGKTLEEARKLEKEFLEATKIYTILSDDNKRARYNRRYKNYIKKEEELARMKRQQEAKTQTRKDTTTEKEKKKTTKKSNYKRHKNIDKNLYNEKDNFNSDITFELYRGTVHVFNEAAFRIKNLKLKDQDSVDKYLKRNKLTFASIALLSSLLLSNFDNHDDILLAKENTATTTTVDDTYERIYILNRIYEPEVGASLSQLALDSNSNQGYIASINDIRNNMVIYGEEITVPYNIPQSELEYYTNQVEYDGTNLEDFANIYQTDIKSLQQLNEEAIVEVGNTYYITSESLTVPNFISKEELNTIKNSEQTKIK